jgi:hypothetical protein
MAQPITPMRPIFKGENIPQALKSHTRWAPWKAVWSEKRGKWDKIPCYPRAPFYGLSTAKPEKWQSFDVAVAAFKANPDIFAGVGYVMTGPHGLVGTDLDGCVDGNTIAPWALEIVQDLASYTELSPSGKGLRIFTLGEVAADWMNHDVGVEVYGGNEPRFLTVTGQRLKMSEHDVVAPAAGVMAALSTRYARERSTTSNVISLTLPEILDELAVPNIAELDIGYAARDFLADGTHRGDRSRELFAAAVSLYSAGLTDDEVFSVLATNAHAFEVALDHRRHDNDRALMYLWVEHCQKAKARASSKVASLDDFEVPESEPNKPLALAESAQAAINSVAKPAGMRFAFKQAADFTVRAPTKWAIKKVLPLAEVGVIYGESGAGKSFFALDLVMAIATGQPWREHKVTQGTVAYICAEGAGGFSLRIKAYAEHYGTDLPTLPLHVLGDAPNLLEKIDVKDLVAALRTIGKVDVVVVDTLAQATPGANENSGEDMGRALSHCKAIHRATGAMVLLVAHAGKDTSRGIRGWSGIKGALDVEISVERSDKYRSATLTKVKDGDGEGEEFPFTLESVVLGQDEDGDDITSCVLKAGNQVPKAQRKAEPKGVWQSVVLKTAIELTDLPGTVTTNQLIDASVNQMPAEEGKRDQRRKNVLRAVEGLVSANRITTVGGEVQVL